MTDEEKNNYVTISTAKTYFAVSDMTIRSWLKAGAPHLKLKTHRRVKIAELENWLKERHDKQA
jgi:excisionase family DNA binding protein